jgi:signal transduction histidine kinase
VRQTATTTWDATKDKLRVLRPAPRSMPASRPSRSEPSAAMFTAIRRRLTLWYTLVLLAIWVLCGTLLYVGTRQALLGGASDTLTTSAAGVAQDWARDWQAQPGSPCHSNYSTVPYLACYPTIGRTLVSGPAAAVPAFTDVALAQKALNSPGGSATDIIDGGNGLGAIQRYALVVPDPSGNGPPIGVVQVGVSIAGDLQALNTLLVQLFVFGAVALVAAWLGGLWLARRALEPARLSFARQQAFIADAAHELRTPLTLMRADAEVLLRGRQRLDPEDAALLDDIVAESAHMGRLTTNMLTLARLDAGTLHIEREIIDLSDVARGAAHRVQAIATEMGLRIESGSDAHASPVLVVADRALVDQAALILLDNAIKYNQPNGTVSIWAEVVGVEAKLIVRDSGPGIPPEHLARLGERFYRVDKARSREAGGAGLGISIARGIAASLGGRLDLASTPEIGTTAALSLPAAQAQARPS